MYFSEIYQSWRNLQEEKYEMLLRALGSGFFEALQTRRVLDLGCGGGFLEDFLFSRGVTADIVGVDTEFFENPFPFVVGDGNELPFKNSSFDAMLCMDAIHLIRSNDFHRVLKRNGLVLMTVFFNDWNYEEKKENLKERLRGFDILLEFEMDGREKEYVILARKK